MFIIPSLYAFRTPIKAGKGQILHVRQLMDSQWEEDVSRVKKADRISARGWQSGLLRIIKEKIISGNSVAIIAF